MRVKKKFYRKYSILKEYNLTVKDISKMFNYSSEKSFRNSTAYPSIMDSLEEFADHIKEELNKKTLSPLG
jgi:uncharacterized protein Yka (UPF0111/DUF47 family)